MTPHLETPKDIATERGEATSEMQLCHVENSTLISHTVAEISVPGWMHPTQLQQI